MKTSEDDVAEYAEAIGSSDDELRKHKTTQMRESFNTSLVEIGGRLLSCTAFYQETRRFM